MLNTSYSSKSEQLILESIISKRLREFDKQGYVSVNQNVIVVNFQRKKRTS